jgi:hypothetical protein
MSPGPERRDHQPKDGRSSRFSDGPDVDVRPSLIAATMGVTPEPAEAFALPQHSTTVPWRDLKNQHGPAVPMKLAEIGFADPPAVYGHKPPLSAASIRKRMAARGHGVGMPVPRGHADGSQVYAPLPLGGGSTPVPMPVTAPPHKNPFPISATVTLGFASGPSTLPGHNVQPGTVSNGMREHALGQPRHKGTYALFELNLHHWPRCDDDRSAVHFPTAQQAQLLWSGPVRCMQPRRFDPCVWDATVS